MVSHDAVALYLLSQEVSRSLKVVQSGQGADEVFAGYSWYPPLREATGTGSDIYRAEFFALTGPVDRGLRIDTEIMLAHR